MEIQTRGVLEFEGTEDAIGFTAYDHEGGEEAQNLEVVNELFGVPDGAVADFQVFSVRLCGLDLREGLTSGAFSRVGHEILP